MRTCSYLQWLDHSPPLIKRFKTLTIYDICKLLLGLFMYNYVSNNLSDTLTDYFIQNRSIYRYSTSTSSIYHPYSFKQDLARNTIRRNGNLYWNTIYPDLRNVKSVSLCKRKYELHLLSYYHCFP